MEFIKKHTAVFLSLFSVMSAAVIFLGAYALVDLSGEREEKNSLSRIYEVEMKNTAENLLMSLKTADKTVSYHYALNALEYAKRAGNLTAAEFFSDVSSAVLEERGGEYTDMLENKIKAGFDENSDKTEPTPETTVRANVTAAEMKRAEKNANELLGLKNTLKYIGGEGELVFACRNAYVVMVKDKCIPRECCISLDTETGEVFSLEECAASARSYLGYMLTADEIGSAQLTENGYDAFGRAYFSFTVGGREINMTVERGRGRLVSMATV